MIYFNARYYDPITGRFLTEDPSRKGVNWYAYCDNNPVNRIDPDGRDEKAAIKALQSSEVLSKKTTDLLAPGLIEGIYAAEASRMSALKERGIKGKSQGPGEIRIGTIHGCRPTSGG